MQVHYEHSVPKVHDCETKRKILVFKHGSTRICEDNGIEVPSISTCSSQPRVWYGHPGSETGIVSMVSLKSRRELSDLNVHE